MKKGLRYISALMLLCITTTSLFAQKVELPKDSDPGIYAAFVTTKGNIIVKLEADKTPMTVANFVGLAEGNLTLFDSVKITKPFYDGLKFHRVIKDFMIQGGDPQGTGMGGPGYKFFDETRPDLTHSGPGILSMANSGPATNGSQFFITHKETPWLNGKHTVFGHVVQGQDVVNKIEANDVMTKVVIIRNGKAYKSWNATEKFKSSYAKVQAEQEVKKAEQAKLDAIEKDRIAKCAAMSEAEYRVYLLNEIRKKYPNAQQTESGLVYVIQTEGNGTRANKGDNVSTHYTGTFLNGTKFDSSRDRNQPLDFTHNVGQMIAGYDEAISILSKGGRGIFVIPYFKAYGAAGRPGGIPPYSDLVFDIELLNIIPAVTSPNPNAPMEIKGGAEK
ncbi:MAG: peptidyl-prolyl cis-trans isomerase cyclophilin type [Fluviicola sp.]|jgi:peptidylprolyl isomerase|uniref:peptidylprolyl isomerase n=1 Tax=Fluviicola sp. TaxID=1917219 RepID=UPI0026271FD9|nr:peptidylprolyl isomerase [Fluviicola sp.]MDF3027834.1 peptidyl-prolyl cis-trans isomerase cyclophilin type [Fluviicola sp.]